VTNREIAWGIVGLTTAHDDAKWERLQDAITSALDAKDASHGVLSGTVAVPLMSLPPAGHIMESDGTVRKVLGTLPVTADGCIAIGGSVLHHPDGGYGIAAGIHGNGPVEMVHYNSRECRLVGELYSTRELAEAAQRAAGGGA
jgi:hypothetical protein